MMKKLMCYVTVLLIFVNITNINVFAKGTSEIEEKV